MLYKKDRKIPHSVYKPHSEEVLLLYSTLFK
jgi:tubulin polyglutamylase TTLL4